MIKNSCVLILLVMMSSCSDTLETQDAKGLETKMTNDFSLSIPSTWKLVSKESQNLPQPALGSIILAASSPDSKLGFSNSLTVLRDSVETDTSLLDISRQLEKSLKQELTSYIKKDTSILTFLDGTESELRIFQARYNPNTPLLLYFQIPQICKNNIYITTLALDTSVTEYEKYKYILSTFTCKNQK